MIQHMSNRLNFRSLRQSQPGGFTLIEMLVATALVMLIMLIFASIYGAAVGTITKQRALANNDAKARAVQQIITNDLQHLTYRQLSTAGTRGLVPLGPGDPVDPRQRGFFYISENDPTDPTDDVLHYTIDLGLSLRRPELARIFGKAANLPVGTTNEPAWDDGNPGSGFGASRYGEVSVFLRGGTLYRRVLLLREPLNSSFVRSMNPAQPSDTSNPVNPPLWSATGATDFVDTNSFWHNFDYSATRAPRGVDLTSTYLLFHGGDALDNSRGLLNHPLAAPRYRFGFIQNAGRPEQVRGAFNSALAQPIEFDNNGNFLGRFLQAESSLPTFLYPGQDMPGLVNPGVLDTNFVLGGIAGLRAGEDVLLNNVLEFNVQVWDPAYSEQPASVDLDGNQTIEVGAWVELGRVYNTVADTNVGRYSVLSKRLAAYGPDPTLPAPPTNRNNIFDTWHPSIIDDSGRPLSPPFRTLKVDPATMAAPNGRWFPNAFPNLNVNLAPTITDSLVFPDFVDDGNPDNDNFAFVYHCIRSGTGGAGRTGTKEPEWPRQHGAIVKENVGTPEEVWWQCVDNRVGLEAIKMTIRYLDAGSGQERQLTIYHSFVE